MVAVVVAVAVAVLTVNVVEVAPEPTRVQAGIAATAGLLMERLTIVPPDGAGASRETLPSTDCPPGTVEGLSARDVKACARTVPRAKKRRKRAGRILSVFMQDKTPATGAVAA